MKKAKFLSAFIAVIMLSVCACISVNANEISLYADGVKIGFPSGSPVIIENVTYAPIRAVVESVGGRIRYIPPVTFNLGQEFVFIFCDRKIYTYKGKEYKNVEITERITANYDKYQLSIVADGNQIVNDSGSLPVKILKINGTIYAPVRYIGELLGYSVSWDEAANAVHYTYIGNNYYIPSKHFYPDIVEISNKSMR